MINIAKNCRVTGNDTFTQCSMYFLLEQEKNNRYDWKWKTYLRKYLTEDKAVDWINKKAAITTVDEIMERNYRGLGVCCKYKQEAQSSCDIFRQNGALKIDQAYNKPLLQMTQNWQKLLLVERIHALKALEIYEFENRQNKNNNWTFSHVQPINTPI